MTNSQERVRSIYSIIPKQWQNEDSIWLSAYNISHLEQVDLPQAVSVEIMGLKAIAFWGKFQYYSIDEVNLVPKENGILHFELKSPELKTSKIGPWVHFLAPYSQNDQNQETSIKKKIKAARALMCSVLGRNAVDQHFCDNVLNLRTGNISGFSPVFKNPFTDPQPIFTIDSIERMQEIYKRIENICVEKTENRYNLSLQWFNDSLDDDGVDAFLKVWIAIEVLLMQSSENIKPLKNLLVKGYGISSQDTTEKYLIGYLCGLRGAIVHDGTVTSLHYGVTRYLEELYKDFLCLSLGLPCPKYAKQYLNGCEFDLKNIIKGYLKAVKEFVH